jgi:WD40 repeat protein
MIRLWSLADGADRYSLAGHVGAVRSLAFSPRGGVLASVGEDGTLRLWSLPVAPQLLSGHSQPILVMAASPDQKLLATASADHVVKVWNLNTGEAAGTLSGHAGPVTGVAWSQDAARIVTCSTDRTVRVWDAATFQQVLQCTGHEAEFTSLALAADQICAGGADGTAAVFRLADGTLLRKLDALGAPVVQVRYAAGQRLLVGLADGSLRTFDAQGTPAWNAAHGAGLTSLAAGEEMAATAGADRVVRLWRLADGAAEASLPPQPADIAGISFCGEGSLALACADGLLRIVSRDGRLEETFATPNVSQRCTALAASDRNIAVGGTDGHVRIFTRSLLALYSAHQGATTSLAWLDDQQLATAGADGTVRLWSRTAAQPIAELTASAPVTGLAAANNGKLLAAASEARQLLAWDLSHPQTPAVSLSLDTVPRGVAVDSAGHTVLAALDDASIAIFDLATGQPLERLRGHAAAVLGISLSADGHWVASASADRTVRLWPRTAQRVLALKQGPARAAWLPDGEAIVSAGAEGPVLLWPPDAGAGTPLEGLEGPIAAVAVAPTGSLAAAASGETVQVWHTGTGQPVQRWQLPQVCVGLAFKTTGERLAAALADGRVRVFEVPSGHLLEELRAGTAPLMTVAMAPDGKTVLAGGADQARLLAVSLLAVLGTHEGGASSVAYLPDGSRLASAGADGLVRVWSLAQGEAVANLNAGEAAACVAWSQDGQRLLCGAGSKLHIWNLADPQAVAFGKQEAILELPAPVKGLAVLREPDRLAAACADGAVHVWSLTQRRELERVGRHSGPVLGVAAVGNTLFSAAADRTAAVTPLACELAVAAHRSVCGAVAWLDDTRFVTAGDDGRVHLFDVAGSPVQQFEAGDTPLAALAVRPGGGELAAAGGRTIFRWNLAQPGEAVRRSASAGITALAYSPDGNKFAAGCENGELRLYASQDARLLERFEFPAAVRNLAFAPDNRWLLASTADGGARLVATSLAMLLSGHKGGASGVAWFADGSRLVSAGQDGRLVMWNAADGSVLAAVQLAGGQPGRVAVSRDGGRVAVAVGKEVLVWNVAELTREGGPPEPLRLAHGGNVAALKFSPDNQRLATAADDGLVRIWDPSTGLSLEQFEAGSMGALAVHWADDNRTLATAAADGTLWLRRTCALRALACGPGPVNAVAWLPDGSLAAVGEDGRVRSFDGNGNQNRLLEGAEGPLFALAARPDGQQIAAGSANRTVYVWTPGGELTQQLQTPAAVRTLAYSQDNSRLLAGGDDGHLRVFQTQQGRLLDDFTDAAPIAAVAIAPDNKTLYSASGSSVKEWLEASPQAVRTLSGHGGPVYAVAFAPQSPLAASASADQTIRIWDTSTGNQVRQITGHQGSVYTVAYSPDGTLLASGGADTTVRIWDASTGSELKRLPGPAAPVYTVCFSPDGRLLAAGGLDKTVRVWDVATSELRWSATGHTDHIYRVVFNPQGTRLLSCGYAGHLHVWDAAEGKPLFSHRLPAVAYYAAYHPQADRVAAACTDAAVHLVPLPAEAQ